MGLFRKRHKFKLSPLSLSVPLDGCDSVVGLQELQRQKDSDQLAKALNLSATYGGLLARGQIQLNAQVAYCSYHSHSIPEALKLLDTTKFFGLCMACRVLMLSIADEAEIRAAPMFGICGP